MSFHKLDNAWVEGEFFDIESGEIQVKDVKIGKGRRIEIYTVDGKKIIFTKERATQLLYTVGVSGWKEDDEVKKMKIMSALSDSDENIVIRVRSGYEKGVFIGVRAVTTEYVPLPHRVLFDFVDDVLRNNGIRWRSESVSKIGKRTVKTYVLFDKPVEISNVDEVIRVTLNVSNANTGRDAVHIYGKYVVLSCENGLTSPKAVKFQSLAHRGSDVDSLLARIGDEVIRVYSVLVNESKELFDTLPKITVRSMDSGGWKKYEEILNTLMEKYGEKYYRLFRNSMLKNVGKYGKTYGALFQTITYVGTRATNREVSKFLNKKAVEVLQVVSR